MLTNELWNINNHFDTPNESIDGIIRATLYNEQMQRDYGFVEIKKLEGNCKITLYEKFEQFFRMGILPDSHQANELNTYKDAIDLINSSGFELQPGWEKVEFPLWNVCSGLIENISDKDRDHLHEEFDNKGKVSLEKMREMFDEMQKYSGDSAYAARVKVIYKSDSSSLVESVCLDGTLRFRAPYEYDKYGIVVKANVIGYAILIECEHPARLLIYDQISRRDIVFGDVIKATYHFMYPGKEGYFSIDGNEYVSNR